MKRHILNLIIISTLSFHIYNIDPQPAPSNINNEQLAQLLKRQIALLEEQNQLTRTLLTVMLENARQESMMLEMAQRETEAAQKLDQEQQERRAQLRKEQQNLPWYEKTWRVSSHLITAYLLNSLLPAIKSQITFRLADKGLECICNGVDMATGDLVEKHWGPNHAYRPGEWLLKRPAEREIAQSRREISRKHPDIEELAQRVRTLKTELRPEYLKATLQQELDELNKFKNEYCSSRSEATESHQSYNRLYQRYLQQQPLVEEPNN